MAELNYRFKKYVPKSKKLNCTAISISKTQLRFNSQCREFLRRKPYCELFYEEENKIIALKPYHLDGPYALKINNWLRPNNTLTVNCKGFLQENEIIEYIGLNHRVEHLQLPADWDDKNKCFFVYLKKYFGESNAEQA